MSRNVLTLFLVFSLSTNAQADFESAKDAIEAGDYDIALELLIPLADQGLAEAQNSLGVMYAEGLGVPQDYDEAIKWYRKAAEQGYVVAQYNLGVMYRDGSGVQQDFIQAYAWIGIAAAGGYAPAQGKRDRISAVLNSAQLEEAHKLAKELWDKYGNKSKNYIWSWFSHSLDPKRAFTVLPKRKVAPCQILLLVY